MTGRDAKAMETMNLALRTQQVLDIPKKTRALLVIAGVAGAGFIVMESLAGNRPETIPIDKILHFSSGGREQPVAMVMSVLSDKLVELAEKLQRAGSPSDPGLGGNSVPGPILPLRAGTEPPVRSAGQDLCRVARRHTLP